MTLDPVETLQLLIRTPSVNPMGRDVSGPEIGESRLTDVLIEICTRQCWPFKRQPVHPNRDNLLILVKGFPTPHEGGELLLWDVHQDTVPVEGMTVAPFGGEVRDGRVYGRGASDVKGTMAAMIAALSRLDDSPRQERPTVLLACTANEECGFTGARALAELWKSREDDDVFTWLPHAAVVAEPTSFNVVVAHQGQVRWRCHTQGRAAHTSRPDKGLNAIYAMAPLVQAIERFHRELSTTGPEHPLCGRPSVCVSTIRGGVGVNTVPELATIEIDRRLAPSDSPTAAYEQLINYLAATADLGGCRVVHDPPFMQSPGLDDRLNGAVAAQLAAIVRGCGRDAAALGAPYGTDAAPIAASGVPCVVFGPGSIDQAHTADEHIAVDELRLGAEIFYEVALRGLRS